MSDKTQETETGTRSEMVPWEESEAVSGIASIEPTRELVEQFNRAVLDGELPPEIGDPKITARLIGKRIIAQSFDQAMSPQAKLPAWSDYMDRLVVVNGFHINPSSFESDEDAGSPSSVYAVVELSLPPSGELVTVQCGGMRVLLTLGKAWEEGRFPLQAVLRGSKTGRGFTALRLERPEGA